MMPDPKNPLTSPSSSGNEKNEDGLPRMDESEQKQWSQRYSWADCREPYKTELDTLGSHWIEGALSNAELALEAVKLLSELDFVSNPGSGAETIRLDDVTKQVKILTEAMLSAELQPSSTPQERRQFLDSMRIEFGEWQDRVR